MKRAHVKKTKNPLDGAPVEKSSANRDIERSEASVAVLTDTLALGLLEPGEQAEILALPRELKQCHATKNRNDSCGLFIRLQRLGLTPGVSVEMADNDGSGFVRLKVEGTELVTGRFPAMKIAVRKKA